MLNSRYTGTSIVVLAILALVPTVTLAVCAQPTRTVPTPMQYPGEMVACPGCCHGPCMCAPNVRYWGFYQRQWRPWPGEQSRVDIIFPRERGIEILKTPKGTVPEKYPKEEYAEPQTDTGPGIQIQQGLPTGPIETPAPFDLGPGFGTGLPGLEGTPQGPAPENQPSLEGLPEAAPKEDGITPGTGSSTQAIPPAPVPYHSSTSPLVPGRSVDEAYLAPPRLESEPSSTLTNPVLPVASTEEIIAPPLAPLPGESKQPEALPADTSQADTAWAPPVEAPVEAQIAELKPIVPEPTRTEPTESKPSPEPEADAPAPLAPLPGDDTPVLTKTPAAPVEGSREKPQKATWKSRRTQAPLPSERTVDYREIVGVGEIGLEGYCPVSLIRSEQWTKGNPQWTVEYKGRTYRMAGPVEQRQFRAHPDRYTPVLCGCDPVLLFEGKGYVAGRTKACVIYKGRLLMFSSRKTLARFQQNPDAIMETLPTVK